MQGLLLGFVAILVVTGFSHNVELCEGQEECLPTQGDAMVYESASLSLEMDDEATIGTDPEQVVKETQHDASKVAPEQSKEMQNNTIPTNPEQLKEQSNATQPSHEQSKVLDNSSVSVNSKMHERANRIPLDVAMVQADGKIAHLIRKAFTDPVKISKMLSKALESALGAVMKFTAKPPLIHEGISRLGIDLLDAFDPLLAESENLDQKAYNEFKEKWKTYFDALPDTLANIETNIRAFTDDGNAISLIEAIEEIMESASDACTMVLPAATRKEVEKFMNAVIGVVDAIGNSWKEFQDGKVDEATQSLYFSLRKVIDALIPEDVRNNTVHLYNTVTGTIDGVMGKITSTTFNYRKRLLESSICYRSNMPRSHTDAKFCDPGYTLIPPEPGSHKRGCTPGGGLLQVNETLNVDKEMLDRVATSKGEQKVDGATAKKDFHEGARFARCDDASDFPEYHGHRCYGKCEPGWQPHKKNCRKSCGDEFPAESDAVCGKSDPQIVQWIVQLVMTTAMSIFQVISNIAGVVKNVVDKGVYSTDDVPNVVATFGALTDMGLNFVNPLCANVMGKKG
jgi:hypothetical protein